MVFKIASFLFPKPAGWALSAFLPLRIVVAAFWLHSDIPRWMALGIDQPEANGLVRHLFGVGTVVPLTYFFTVLETLAAISFLLGLLTRLAAVWGVVEFAIIATTLFLGGMIEQGLVHALLFATCLVLLLNGSPVLSVDGLIAKRLQ